MKSGPRDGQFSFATFIIEQVYHKTNMTFINETCKNTRYVEAYFLLNIDGKDEAHK